MISKNKYIIFFLVIFGAIFLFFFLKKNEKTYDYSTLHPPYDKLLAIQKKIKRPIPKGDWNPDDKSTKKEIAKMNKYVPIHPSKKRHTIYIQPIGKIPRTWQKIINSVAKFLHVFYCVKVTRLRPISSDIIPFKMLRRNYLNKIQHFAPYITDHILTNNIPKDAIAVIAFDNNDLWKDKNSPYITHYTNYQKRTSVWALQRIGRPRASKESYHITLKRLIKTITQEIGFFMGLNYSTHYVSLMNGYKNLREAENQAIFLNPYSLQYIMSFSKCSLEKRFNNIGTFFLKNEFPAHTIYYKKAISIISEKEQKK